MRVFQYVALCMVAWLFLACSEGGDEAMKADSQTPTLELAQGDTLQNMMDKLMHVLSSSAFHTPISEEFFKTPAGAMISKELDTLNQTLQQSYAYIQNLKSDMTCSINPYHLPWVGTHAPFSNLSPTQKFEGIIKQTLALYLCQDALQQDMSPALQESEAGTLETLSVLLGEFEKTAEAADEREALAEFGIQVRLIALYGSYRFMATDQNIDKKAQEAMIAQLKENLERDKGLLPQGHYEFYIATLGLLEEEIAGVKPLLQRVFDELLDYPYVLLGYDAELDSESGSRLALARETFGLFMANDLYSLRAQEIANLAQESLNRASENPRLQNYLYGLSYLTLALIGRDVELNLPLAQEMLQKDFKDTQIRAHRFDRALLKNSCDVLALGAMIYASKQDFEPFGRLVSAFRSEYSPYTRELGEEVQFHNDVYKKLSTLAANPSALNAPADKEITDNSQEGYAVDSEGYLNVPLLLSPQEIEGIEALEGRSGGVDSEILESRGESGEAGTCFSPTEVEFMLSIAYQAYKARGFEGVAPDMINIRLEDLFGLDMTQERQEKLIDYGRFFVLQNSADFSESTPEALCGKHVIIDKDNGLILNEIAPERLLISEGERVYYRLKWVDFALNLFLFYNNEETAQALLQAPRKSEILDSLLTHFPHFREYLDTRLSAESTAQLITKPK